MRLRTAILSTALLLSAPLLVAQDTYYDYTGSPFDVTATGPFTSTESITGFLELAAPLAADLGTPGNPGSLYVIPTTDIVQWSFSVNGTPLTVTSSEDPTPYFAVITDSSANIVDSNFHVSDAAGDGFVVLDNNLTVNYQFSDTANLNGVQGLGTAYGISNIGGSWKDPSPTPEPSSFVLMFTALLGFGFAARKQLAPRLLSAGRIAR